MTLVLRAILIASLLAGSVGCGTYKGDVETMCSAPTKAELPKDLNPADKATVMAAWIDERLKTSKGKELFKALPAVTPGARAKMLREAATQEGLAGCAFADFYAEYAK